mgnify:CR=1 FL=1
MVFGTSVGSLVGSIDAYGYSAQQLQTMPHALERDDIINRALPDNGFVKGEKLEGYVNRMVRDTPIEKFRIPFHAVATDIKTGEEFVFGTGNAGMAVRASCAIPGIFKPSRISGRTFSDGGIVSPLAVDIARRYRADAVIAVDISSGIAPATPQGMVETILQSVDIMYAKIAALQLPRADVVIRPAVGHIGSTDFIRKGEAMIEGEKAARAAMPAIQASFSLTAVALSWVSLVYLLAVAASLVPFAKLADRLGRKRIYAWSWVVVVVGCALAVFAPSAWVLYVARAVQGVGAGMSAATSPAILTAAFPPEERGKALGINIGATYAGLTVGPVLGGVMTGSLGWHSIFVFTGLISAATLVYVILELRGLEWSEPAQGAFDFLGTVLYIVGLCSLCLLYTSPSPRDRTRSRMPSSA